MKRIYTPEQKAKNKITLALKKANRSPEQIVEDIAKKKIVNARYVVNRSLEKVAEDKIYKAKYYQENREDQIAQGKKSRSKHDLGYFAVYVIDNYIGTEASYCGQTKNLYTRMSRHRNLGRMNTENHRVLQCFETREQAMAFEAIQHEAGYHGYNNGH